MGYVTALSGSGREAVIQGPGWGPSSDYLRLTLVPLLPSLRTLTYDVRNTGLGPRRTAPESQAVVALADDLDRLRRAYELDNFVLIGHSHGGFISMAYAALHASAVSALVLVAPSLEAPALPPASASQIEMIRWLRGRMAQHFVDQQALERFRSELRHSPAPSLEALRGMPAQREEWVGQSLPALTVPTLVVLGAQDRVIPPEQGRRVAELIPDSRLVVLERAGHNPWLEQPAAFCAALENFLQTH